MQVVDAGGKKKEMEKKDPVACKEHKILLVWLLVLTQNLIKVIKEREQSPSASF